MTFSADFVADLVARAWIDGYQSATSILTASVPDKENLRARFLFAIEAAQQAKGGRDA